MFQFSWTLKHFKWCEETAEGGGYPQPHETESLCAEICGAILSVWEGNTRVKHLITWENNIWLLSQRSHCISSPSSALLLLGGLLILRSDLDQGRHALPGGTGLRLSLSMHGSLIRLWLFESPLSRETCESTGYMWSRVGCRKLTGGLWTLWVQPWIIQLGVKHSKPPFSILTPKVLYMWKNITPPPMSRSFRRKITEERIEWGNVLGCEKQDLKFDVILESSPTVLNVQRRLWRDDKTSWFSSLWNHFYPMTQRLHIELSYRRVTLNFLSDATTHT